MNRIVHLLPNGLKTLIIGLTLAVLPWIASIYWCTEHSDSGPAPESSPSTASEKADSRPPDFLPAVDSARCLQANDSPSQQIFATNFPAEQIQPLDHAITPQTVEPAKDLNELLMEIAESAKITAESARETTGSTKDLVEHAKEIAQAAKEKVNAEKETAEIAKLTTEPVKEIAEPVLETIETAIDTIESPKITTELIKESAEPSNEIVEIAKEIIQLKKEAAELAKEIDELDNETAEPAKELPQLVSEMTQPAKGAAKSTNQTTKPVNETAESANAENAQPAYIPPIGIVAADNFDHLYSDVPSPPVWMPTEMPIADQAVGPSLGRATTPAQIPAESTSDADTSPEPNASETLAISDASAESDPAAQPPTVINESNDLAIDSERIYPSTDPIFIAGAESEALPVRSEQLESIARHADQQIRHGFELAGRKAYFAARSEFIVALRLVAQGLDTDEQTRNHGKSLAAGLTALKEAEDFIPSGSKLEADLDIPGIIASHSTSVLKDAELSAITPLTALKSYFKFAQEKLAQAAGREVAGSMALHALGKLHEELAKDKGSNVKSAGPKAVVFYQAALLVSPQNYLAANDLGVMLARNGNYKDALTMLKHSLSICKQSTVWQNLAVVYEKLGYREQAQQAQQQAQIARQTEQNLRQNALVASNDRVRWVDENTFSQNYFKPFEIPQTSLPRPANPGNVSLQKPSPVQANPVPTQGVIPSIQNPYWATNEKPEQAPSTTNRTLPAMRPTTTVLLPKIPYESRR